MIHMILMGVVTILAIVVGPVIAVLVTRKMDQERSDKARKMDIFRTLMRTRGLPIHWDHVGALNLVEVEFINHPEVIQAWTKYLDHLNERPPIEQAQQFEAFVKKTPALLTTLIDAIAKALDIKIGQLDILRGNYVPSGWSTDEDEQRWLRRGLLNALSGKVSIPIQIRENDDPPPGRR